MRRATCVEHGQPSPCPNFYPRSPCGERHGVTLLRVQNRDFYPRSPCGERLAIVTTCLQWYVISIHALLAESDVANSHISCSGSNFYPRSPCGERPVDSCSVCSSRIISIHALLAESDRAKLKLGQEFGISIHALLAESDPADCYCWVAPTGISIHALLAESDIV